jgi:hypothetical protein
MLLAASRGEYPFTFLAGENRASCAHHAGRVQVLGMLFDVEEGYLLRDPVEDVLGALAATLAIALFTAKLLGQTAQARYLVGTEDA